MRPIQNPPSLLLPLPDSALGTRETLKHMRKLVWKGKQDPALRDRANTIVLGLAGKEWAQQVEAVFNWVRKNVRYTLDTNDWEVIQSPELTLKLGYGDCDDFCILLATLLEHLGYSTAFAALGFGDIGTFSHVIVFAELEGELPPMALDATESNPAGWLPPGITCSMLCPNSWGSSWASCGTGAG